jgi:hypothetical protein
VRHAIICHHLMAGDLSMPEPQLSVRSARARDLAHALAKRERRTVAQVVELALEDYSRRQQHSPEPIGDFIKRLTARDPDDTIDIDLDALIREGREPHKGIDLE